MILGREGPGKNFPEQDTTDLTRFKPVISGIFYWISPPLPHHPENFCFIT